jgi:hypothetical protein
MQYKANMPGQAQSTIELRLDENESSEDEGSGGDGERESGEDGSGVEGDDD